MIKKEVVISSIVVTDTLFLSSTPFCVLSDSGVIHSFISTRSALQLDLEHINVETNHRIKLSYTSTVDYPVFYKYFPIYIGESIFFGDLI